MDTGFCSSELKNNEEDASASDDDNLEDFTPEQTAMFKLMKTIGMPQTYFGPALCEDYFECRIRVYPVTMNDLSSMSLKEVLTALAGITTIFHFEKTLGMLEMLCMLRTLKFVVKKLMFAEYERPLINVEVMQHEEFGDKQYNEYAEDQFPHIECKASFKMRAGFAKQRWLDNIEYSNSEELSRSLYLCNLPESVPSKFLRKLFPLAVSCKRVESSHDQGSAAFLCMKSTEIMSAHLSNISDLNFNGQTVEISKASEHKADMLQHYAAKLSEKTEAAAALAAELEKMKIVAAAGKVSQEEIDAVKVAVDSAASALHESDNENEEEEDVVKKLNKNDFINRKGKGCPSDIRRNLRRKQEYMKKLSALGEVFSQTKLLPKPLPFSGGNYTEDQSFANPRNNARVDQATPTNPPAYRPVVAGLPVAPPYPGDQHFAAKQPPTCAPPQFHDDIDFTHYPSGRQQVASGEMGFHREQPLDTPPPFPGEKHFEEQYSPEPRLPRPDSRLTMVPRTAPPDEYYSRLSPIRLPFGHEDEPFLRRHDSMRDYRHSQLITEDDDPFLSLHDPVREHWRSRSIPDEEVLDDALLRREHFLLDIEAEEEALARYYRRWPPNRHLYYPEDGYWAHPLPPPWHDLDEEDLLRAPFRRPLEEDISDISFDPMLRKGGYHCPPHPVPQGRPSQHTGMATSDSRDSEPPGKRAKYNHHSELAKSKKRERDRQRMTEFIQRKQAESNAGGGQDAVQAAGAAKSGGSSSSAGAAASAATKSVAAEISLSSESAHRNSDKYKWIAPNLRAAASTQPKPASQDKVLVGQENVKCAPLPNPTQQQPCHTSNRERGSTGSSTERSAHANPVESPRLGLPSSQRPRAPTGPNRYQSQQRAFSGPGHSYRGHFPHAEATTYPQGRQPNPTAAVRRGRQPNPTAGRGRQTNPPVGRGRQSNPASAAGSGRQSNTTAGRGRQTNPPVGRGRQSNPASAAGSRRQSNTTAGRGRQPNPTEALQQSQIQQGQRSAQHGQMYLGQSQHKQMQQGHIKQVKMSGQQDNFRHPQPQAGQKRRNTDRSVPTQQAWPSPWPKPDVQTNQLQDQRPAHQQTRGQSWNCDSYGGGSPDNGSEQQPYYQTW